MNKKSLLIFLPLLLLVTACSTVKDKPKPVAKTVKPKTQQPLATAPKKQPAAPEKAVKGTATYAIDDGKNSFKVEPTQSAIKAGATAAPIVATPITESTSATPATTTPAVPAVSAEPVTPATSEIQAVKATPAAPVMPAFPVEDVRLPAGSQPAVVALLTEADKNKASGDLDAAVVSTERALRIDSRNPTLTYKLAQLRIKQNKPQLAEELAGKAALLAGNNLDLKRKSWLLIAEARRQQQNYPGAKEAKTKADSFYGH
jgi:hypothetical protein